MSSTPTLLMIAHPESDRQTYQNWLQPLFSETQALLQASTAAEGLALYEKHQPGIILLTETLPDREGRTLLTQLYSSTAESVTRKTGSVAIALLQQEDESEMLRWMQAGAADCWVQMGGTAAGLRLVVRRAIATLNLRFQLQQAVDHQHQCEVALSHPKKQAEALLRSSEERFRLATRAATGVIYDWDASSTVVYRSEGLYDLLGLHPEEVPATRDWWSSRIHPDDLAQIEQPMFVEIDGLGDRYAVEYRVRHQDGHWVHVWDRGYLIRNVQGQLVRVVGSTTDITERKQLEQELRRQTEELAFANRLKDEFLTVLSHELRTPLNPILGWATLLQTRQFSPEKIQDGLSTIERNAKLQAQLVDDLLDVSRIMRGKLTLNLTPVKPLVPLLAAIETTRLSAEARSIRLETQLDPQVGLVMGDATRIQQIVWNLLSNAIKFTPEGGKVEVRLERKDEADRVEGEEAIAPALRKGSAAENNANPLNVHPSSFVPSSGTPPSPPSPGESQLQASSFPAFVQITVSDTGKGISPEFLPHVFELFRQQDGSTTRQFGGLGLGLAIVRQLVEAHNGSVSVSSAGEGLGTTFTVCLPLIPHSSASDLYDSAPAATPDLKGVRVLLVDDDADSLRVMTTLLEEEGAIATSAPSASAALQHLAKASFDVLISDVGMPQVDGYALIRQIRMLPAGQGGTIPAIALTAYASEANQEQAYAAGFQQHIAKPVQLDVLVRAIAALCSTQPLRLSGSVRT